MISPRPAVASASTSVVIVGAGPAGLTVANVLRSSGVDCVVLEAESREFIEHRPRAGFLEEWALRELGRRGLAGPQAQRAEAQADCEFRLEGERHVFRYGELSGHRHFVHPQPLLVTDLVRAYVDEAGGDARFGVRDVALHDIDGPDGPGTERPAVSWTDPGSGERHRLACDFVAGCDGARGVTRKAVPEGAVRIARHDLGVGWLALLAEAPPSSQRVGGPA